MQSVETFPSMHDAARALGDGDRFLAGGTLVMRDVNFGAPGIARLLRAEDAGACTIRTDRGQLVIGAAVTMAQVVATRETDFLASVARSIGGPAIRNMATVGGNLFAPHPYGDFATALLALDAEVVWSDGRSEPIETVLAQRGAVRGLVSAVRLVRPQGGSFRYLKVSRVKPKGVSVLSIAAHLPGTTGRVTGARLAFGAMGPAPLRAKAAEAALEGVALDANGISRALGLATDGLAPSDDPLASAWYRREVAPVHLKRLLLGEGRV